MNWSTHWKGSKNPSKQRKYVRNAPLHTKSKFLGSHLSKPLREKYKTRTLRVRKGDKVKVLRGQHKGKTGTVDRIATSKQKVYITGIDYSKKDGSKALYPIHASNILIQEIEGTEKRRLGEKK